MKKYIDWTIFLGMNHVDDIIRISCKNFFVDVLQNNEKIYMTLETVGKCDDVIWKYERDKQDKYYPFMDVLHTYTNFHRFPYEANVHKKIPIKTKLSFFEKMTIASSYDGILYTYNKKILATELKNIKKPELSKEKLFQEDLEKLYNDSLVLKINF